MKERVYTISIDRASYISLLLVVPIGMLLILPFIAFHGLDVVSFKSLTADRPLFGVLKFAASVTLGIFVHELLHGIGWVFFTKKKWRSISFGIKWEYVTPYCHCKEPLNRFAFLIGAALPLLILGILPVVISYFSGNFVLWFFGFFFTVAAGGDIIAIWMLRVVKKGQLVQDHPEELGFIIIDFRKRV